MKNNHCTAQRTAARCAASSAQFCEDRSSVCYATRKLWAMISVSKGDRNPQPDTPTSRPTATITTCLIAVPWTLASPRKLTSCCPAAVFRMRTPILDWRIVHTCLYAYQYRQTFYQLCAENDLIIRYTATQHSQHTLINLFVVSDCDLNAPVIECCVLSIKLFIAVYILSRMLLITSTKLRRYCDARRLSVCLSVSRISQKVIDRF